MKNNREFSLFMQHASVPVAIENILNKASKPISTLELSFLTNLPTHRVCHTLKYLEKTKRVRKSTVKTVAYWRSKQ